jgi:hypothetical protein
VLPALSSLLGQSRDYDRDRDRERTTVIKEREPTDHTTTMTGREAKPSSKNANEEKGPD